MPVPWAEIVNYCDPSTIKAHIDLYENTEREKLGFVRYVCTNRKYQQIDDVPVYIYPADFAFLRTPALSRGSLTMTGKSNTTKNYCEVSL